MQQIIKKFSPLKWLAAVLFATMLFIGCNSSETKTEPAAVEVNIDATTSDSMPVIDTTATSRPEDAKTH